MNKALVTKHINGAAEEIEACIVEGVYNAQITLVEMYHTIGGIVRDLPGPITKNVYSLLETPILQNKKVGERTLWFCVKLFDTYPDINQLPDGKAVSVASLKRLLAPQKDEEECPHEQTITAEYCVECHKKISTRK